MAAHSLPDGPSVSLLLAPQNVLPDVLVVVQVALEGAISRKAAASSLSRGELPQASETCGSCLEYGSNPKSCPGK